MEPCITQSICNKRAAVELVLKGCSPNFKGLECDLELPKTAFL